MVRMEEYWRRAGVPVCTDCSNMPTAGRRCRTCQDKRNEQKRYAKVRSAGGFAVARTLAEHAKAARLQRTEVVKRLVRCSHCGGQSIYEDGEYRCMMCGRATAALSGPQMRMLAIRERIQVMREALH